MLNATNLGKIKKTMVIQITTRPWRCCSTPIPGDSDKLPKPGCRGLCQEENVDRCCYLQDIAEGAHRPLGKGTRTELAVK